jgi:carbamoyltransferase
MNIVENVKLDYVANILLENNIVAIFQGRSESGPRALGNRSFLFNPAMNDGKNYVNNFKGRELFRPLSCSILDENFNEWFETENNNHKFMTFSSKVIESKKDKINSVVHVDGTSRVQTVTEEDNFYYYRLIKSFYNISSIPILGNTSFNFSGEPLVETVEDSLKSFSNSNLKFLYYPELSLILEK